MIDLRSIKTYYLNPDSFLARRNTIEAVLNNLNMNYERWPSVTHLSSKQNNYSFGSIGMVEKAISNNEYPFLLLDDDVDAIVDFPEKIYVPEECDILYLGASLYECAGRKPPLKLEDFDPNYYRIYYPLSSHALLIMKKSAAEKTIEILKKSLEDGEFSDINMAMESDNLVYLTPKDGPYFYQTDAHTSLVTKFLWKDIASSYL